LLTAAARARIIGGAVCMLDGAGQGLSVTLDDVPIVKADGPQGAWLSAVWTATSSVRDARARWHNRAGAIARELHREWRRSAGDDRLPFELRQRLRAIADTSIRRARPHIDRFPRRLLRHAPTVLQLSDVATRARTELAAHGITDDSPVVTFETRTRPDIASAAIEVLHRDGYTVAWLGDRREDSRTRDGVVDVTTAIERSPLLQMSLVATSAFVVCESVDVQQLACLTNTPSLLINAKEPFMPYPIAANGLYVLATAIDLERVQKIDIETMFTEPYFRDLRKREARGRRRGSFGYRDNTADEVVEAIRELQAAVASNWTNESDSQRRFRALVVEAGAALAEVSPHVVEWGPDAGFIGDGRLVRFQADRVS
jgi:putative glycosyltransferase (TIGR04372 family)